jgi:hypothetical protein
VPTACVQSTKNENRSVQTLFVDTIIGEVSIRLDDFMKQRSMDSIVVFRLKDYDCGECKKYFIDLYHFARKNNNNVVILSQFSGYRSVTIFKKMTEIHDTIININNPISKFDITGISYIFLYKIQDNIAHCYVPVKNDNFQNERIIQSFK